MQNVVASVEYIDNGKTMYLSVVDVTGFFEYYLSEKDIFDDLISDEYEKVEALRIEEDELKNTTDDLLISYLMLVLRLSEEDSDDLIKESVGKYLTKDIIDKYDDFDTD